MFPDESAFLGEPIFDFDDTPPERPFDLLMQKLRAKMVKPEYPRFVRVVSAMAPAIEPATYYEGINLSQVMVPQHDIQPWVCYELWDKMCFHKLDPMSVTEIEIWEGYKDPDVAQIREYAQNDPARLLYCLAQHCEATFDNGLVTLFGIQFGVFDGQVVSQYAEGPMNLDFGWLQQPTPIRSRERYFQMIWNALKDPVDRRALSAARVGSMGRLAQRAKWLIFACRPIPVALREEVLHDVLRYAPNPAFELEKIFCPRILSPIHFWDLFGITTPERRSQNRTRDRLAKALKEMELLDPDFTI